MIEGITAHKRTFTLPPETSPKNNPETIKIGNITTPETNQLGKFLTFIANNYIKKGF